MRRIFFHSPANLSFLAFFPALVTVRSWSPEVTARDRKQIGFMLYDKKFYRCAASKIVEKVAGHTV
jgi:hypothetical protein